MLNYTELTQDQASKLDPITPSVYQEKLRSLWKEYENGRLFAFYENSTLCGWYFLFIPEAPLGSCFVFIFVDPIYRRLGYGTAIYRHAEKEMLASGHNWWSSYPADDGADAFALAVGFDYTSPNSFMVYESGTSSNKGEADITDADHTEPGSVVIRPYEDRDYPLAADIWTNEYAKMHRDLGLPFNAPSKSDEDRKLEQAKYHKNRDFYFVVEKDGQVAGIGGLFDDNSGIGMLAVDSKYQGQGLGTLLTRFLIRECIHLGNPAPCIYCETNNPPAFHVYEKSGFKEKIRESTAIKR